MEAVPDKLPGSVRVLVARIGLSGALLLVERYGGTAVFVPTRKRLKEDHELAKLLGLSAAQDLAAKFAGTWIRIPRCAAMLREERNQQMRVEHAAGKSGAQLAREYRMTDRNVWLILAGSERTESNAQGKLFGI